METIVVLQSSTILLLIGLILAMIVKRDFSVNLAIPAGIQLAGPIQIETKRNNLEAKPAKGIPRSQATRYARLWERAGWKVLWKEWAGNNEYGEANDDYILVRSQLHSDYGQSKFAY